MSKAFIQEPSSQVLRAPFNPYIAGNPVKGQDGFFGRDDIFREVLQMLRHPQSNAIVLYGQRRIGKTSVLLELERRLASEGEFTPIYFDLQGKAATPLAELLFELAQSIAARTGQAVPDRANFDSAGEYFRRAFLTMAAQAAGRGGLVLLFDEFDVFDGPEPSQSSKAFFPYLRDWMAGVEGVHFVFVIGRRPEDLSIETMSTFKGIRAARVSLLEREAAEAVVRKSERDGSLVWTDTACEKVWDWAQGHPYFTQLLCSVVWENAHDDARESTPSVSVGDVDAAIDEALQQGANAFHCLWDGLPPAERVVMAAMAEAGDEIITSEKLEEILNRSGVRIIVRELTLAPDTLVDWGLLRSVDSGNRFVVPLLRCWVATNRPLSRVKDEIDRLDPFAERLFQNGQSFYNIGELTNAETQLREALRINTNHLKSRLLLGRILLEGNHAAESVAILGDAYQYDVGAARSDLIKSLLAMVDGQAELEQLATYERVLNIDPNQPVARECRRTIWIARGEAAVTQKQWAAALEAFQKAGDLKQVAEVGQLKRKEELATRMNDVARLEAEENWDAAIAIYQALFQEYPDENELQARVENTQFQALLMQHYNEAIGALENGDTKNAQRLLAKVIGEQPDYKEAARHLFQATTGSDVQALKLELAAEREKRVAAEALAITNRQTEDEFQKRLETVRAEASAVARRESEAQLEDIEDEFVKRLETARAEASAVARRESEAQLGDIREAQLQKRLETACAEAAGVARRESEAQIEEIHEQLEASRKALTLAVSSAQTSNFDSLRAAIEEVDAQRTQSDTLTALVSNAAQFAPRVVLFVLKGGEAVGWKARGFENALNDETAKLLTVRMQTPSLLADALNHFRTTISTSTSPGDNSAVLGLYGSPRPERAVAVPLVVRGQAAAVLYADSGTQSENSINTAAIETLMRAASLGIELLPARREAEAGSPPVTVASAHRE